LLSIFQQCCEKGTRGRKLGPPRYWWIGTAGEAQLKQFIEVRLKQSCARFGIWVEQASQPAMSQDEPPERTTPAALFVFVELVPASAGLFLVRASSVPAIVLRQHHTQPFSCEDEEPRPNSA
jgi:hypothetical protein